MSVEYFFDLDSARLRAPVVAATPAVFADFERAIDELLAVLGA